MEKTDYKTVGFRSVSFGCDPEFFFRKDGKIIGAEKVLPKGGQEAPRMNTRWTQGSCGKVIIDGVQAELNPAPNTCRQLHSNYIAELFRSIVLPKGVKTDFSVTVEVDQKEMETLSGKAQQFGCSPSLNIYGKKTTGIEDASKYFYRSAGGHIHLGSSIIKGNEEEIVALLDILLGNTSVLIDRDSGNIERRKVYGRAGEYRETPYGLEYRTLSNFWLINYSIMSLVFGLARTAVSISHFSKNNKTNFAKKFIEAVDKNDIINAINNNDYDLALSNFLKIKPLIEKYLDESVSLNKYNIDYFLVFASEVRDKGLKHFFPIDPYKHWINHEYHGVGVRGWEDFIAKYAHDKELAKIVP